MMGDNSACVLYCCGSGAGDDSIAYSFITGAVIGAVVVVAVETVAEKKALRRGVRVGETLLSTRGIRLGFIGDEQSNVSSRLAVSGGASERFTDGVYTSLCVTTS